MKLSKREWKRIRNTALLNIAAPDLLETLKAAMEAIRYFHEHEGAEDLLKAARAAIAKAEEGE
jgi:hypothetical protein